MLGYKNVSITLDAYTNVTKKLTQRKFEDLDEKLKENMESVRHRLWIVAVMKSVKKLSVVWCILFKM